MTAIRAQLQTAGAARLYAGSQLTGRIQLNAPVTRPLILEWRWATQDPGDPDTGSLHPQTLSSPDGQHFAFDTDVPLMPTSLDLPGLRLGWALVALVDGQEVTRRPFEIVPRPAAELTGRAFGPSFAGGTSRTAPNWTEKRPAVRWWRIIRWGVSTVLLALLVLAQLAHVVEMISKGEWTELLTGLGLVGLFALASLLWQRRLWGHRFVTRSEHLLRAALNQTALRPGEAVIVSATVRPEGDRQPDLWFVVECLTSAGQGGPHVQGVAYRERRRIGFERQPDGLWRAQRTVYLPEDAPASWTARHHALHWRALLTSGDQTLWSQPLDMLPWAWSNPIQAPNGAP